MAARQPDCRALGDSGRGQRLLQTVYGQGYRFRATVTPEAEAPRLRLTPLAQTWGAPPPGSAPPGPAVRRAPVVGRAVLARRREPARLLLLGTYRPPDVRRQAHPLAALTQELQLHGHSVEVPVPGLAADAIAAYLTRRLPGLRHADALARLVHQHTEGNPLFMITLVDAWLRQGVLSVQGGVWTLPSGGEWLHDACPTACAS